jgi:hypothetical protein
MAQYIGSAMMPESHWAVAAIDADERQAAIALAEQVCSLGPPPRDTSGNRERLAEIAGAYDLAARERLEAVSALQPHELPEHTRIEIEHAAARAFVLRLSLPVPTDADAEALHVLQLAAMAEVANRRGDWYRWESWASGAALKLDDSERDIAWDRQLLLHVTELWRVLLRDPSGGQDRAMEIIARVRERRTEREAALFAPLDARHTARAKFFLFAWYHVLDAATELLLYLRHGEPRQINHVLALHLSLARSATSGDYELEGLFTWLKEAAVRVARPTVAQLELPGVGA